MNPARWHARAAWAGAWAALVALLVPAGVAADTQWHTLTRDRVERSYRVDVPDGQNTRGAPLLVALHGGGGNADTMARQSGLSAQAAGKGFVVAYPNGSGRRQRARLRTWNAGGKCCGYAYDQAVDDVGFLRALIAEVTATYGTDPRRVYLTGMSNGAMMAYRMACEAADLVAGIAPVAGALHVPCSPSRPVALIAFHGTADHNVPYAGGQGHNRVDRDRLADPPVAQTLAFWAARNGCAGAPARETLARGAVLHDVWRDCVPGAPTQLYTIVDGGHSWPGGERISRLLDPPSQALSVSATMLEFFSRR